MLGGMRVAAHEASSVASLQRLETMSLNPHKDKGITLPASGESVADGRAIALSLGRSWKPCLVLSDE